MAGRMKEMMTGRASLVLAWQLASGSIQLRWKTIARQPSGERRKRDLLDNANGLCPRVLATHVWVTEFIPGDTSKQHSATP